MPNTESKIKEALTKFRVMLNAKNGALKQVSYEKEGGKINKFFYGGPVESRFNLPKQSYISQDNTSAFGNAVKNKWNDFLYNIGWKADGGPEGKGGLQTGIRNMVLPAATGSTLMQMPLVAGTLGAVNLPGSYRQARNSFLDENATTGEKIRNTTPLGVNALALGFGAYNLPRSVGRINTVVRANPPYTVQSQRLLNPYAGVTRSTKVTGSRVPNTVTQNIVRGQGHQGFVTRGSGNRTLRSGWDTRSGGYQQASHVPQTAVPSRAANWQAPRAGWGNIMTVPPMPYQQTPEAQEVNNLQEIELNVPYYGSPAFQRAYGDAEAQGLESFDFGGNSYIVKPGNPSKNIRAVTTGNVPEQILDYPDYKFQHYPDSVSTRNNEVDTNSSGDFIRDLNYGVSGVPRQETTTLNRLKDIINNRHNH